ncbi:AP-5 complex subunit mu-1-like [Haemaphysalis longicornis]
MSIRALCIISIPHKDAASTVYYRRFPTCEKRAQRLPGYVPLPPHKALAAALASCLDDNELRGWRERVDQPLQLPALELSTAEGALWPFVFIKEQGLYFGCLPLMSSPHAEERLDLLSLPEVTAALLIVQAAIQALGNNIASLTATSGAEPLEQFLSVACPFGLVQFTQPSVVQDILREPMMEEPSHMVPAWRPTAYRGKPVLRLQLKETVHSTQCDRLDVSSMAQVCGHVRVHAELECRELWVAVSVPPDMPAPMLAAHVELAPSTSSSAWRVHLNPPPTHPVEAVRYVMPPVGAPILGLYSMRGDKRVDFLLQLKLQAGVPNAFQSLEVRVPFFNRGCIKKSSLTPSCGSVSVARDKCSLIWAVGQKFPASSQEVSLTGTVHFNEQALVSNMSKLCVGLTSYVQVDFRMTQQTLSGCSLDPKSVQVTPQTKFKLVIDHEVESLEYKIWNKFGEVPFATSNDSS